MKKIVGLLLLLALVASACTTKSKAQAQARVAFLAGQQQALARMQPQGLTVQVVGPVRNPIIQWTEDLTLAKASVAAEYQGANPHEIIIYRGGETIRVTSHNLLRGEDTPLQARDVVEIRP